jgi:uncharacterized Zn finger protein
LGFTLDRVNPRCYNKDTEKEREEFKMRTIGEVENIVGEDWRDTSPKYENLNDNRTMEWSLIQEITDVKNELQELVNMADRIDKKLVGGLQQGSITSWEQISELLATWCDKMGDKMDGIIERFD